MKEQIFPKNGPKPVGPYSPAIRAGGFVFVSGQGPLQLETGQPLRGPIADQVHQTLRNLRLLLESAGSTMDKVVKTTIFLRDLGDFKTVNEIYAGYFGAVPPARTTIQAADLPLGIDVEIEAIALA
ncbi:MAG: Rid family detoxifying hydrolase [Acidobacteriota bacterium]